MYKTGKPLQPAMSGFVIDSIRSPYIPDSSPEMRAVIRDKRAQLCSSPLTKAIRLCVCATICVVVEVSRL